MGCSINKNKITNSTTFTNKTNDNFEQYLKSVGTLAESQEIKKAKLSYQIQKNPIILRRVNKSKQKLDEIDQEKLFVN